MSGIFYLGIEEQATVRNSSENYKEKEIKRLENIDNDGYGSPFFNEELFESYQGSFDMTGMLVGSDIDYPMGEFNIP